MNRQEKYQLTLDKLQKAYDKRNELQRQLKQAELDIDACLFLLYYVEEKDESQ